MVKFKLYNLLFPLTILAGVDYHFEGNTGERKKYFLPLSNIFLKK